MVEALGEAERHREVLLDVLIREERHARRDPAEERHGDAPERMIAVGRKPDRARFRRVLVEEPATLEVGELAMDTRG